MMLSRSGESGNWERADGMNETLSVRVLRQLLSCYSSIEEDHRDLPCPAKHALPAVRHSRITAYEA